jgi:hypothetical protein
MLYMVLDDGETFASLEGCQIVEVPDGDEIEEMEGSGLPVVFKFEATRGENIEVTQYSGASKLYKFWVLQSSFQRGA